MPQRNKGTAHCWKKNKKQIVDSDKTTPGTHKYSIFGIVLISYILNIENDEICL